MGHGRREYGRNTSCGRKPGCSTKIKLRKAKAKRKGSLKEERPRARGDAGAWDGRGRTLYPCRVIAGRSETEGRAMESPIVPSSQMAYPVPCLSLPVPPSHGCTSTSHRYVPWLQDTSHLPCRYLYPPSVASREIAPTGNLGSLQILYEFSSQVYQLGKWEGKERKREIHLHSSLGSPVPTCHLVEAGLHWKRKHSTRQRRLFGLSG